MNVNEEKFAIYQTLLNDETTLPDRVTALERMVAILSDQLEHRIERSVEYFERADEWRDRYIAMRSERDAAMDGWFDAMRRQLEWETHLEGHRRDIDLSRKGQHDQVARELLERIEFWLLKREVEAQDLDLPE